MITRADGVVAAHIEGQLVALSPSLQYVALDPMGEVIWNALDEASTVDDIVTVITERFDVDDATCRADVGVFLAQLADQGLVRLDA